MQNVTGAVFCVLFTRVAFDWLTILSLWIPWGPYLPPMVALTTSWNPFLESLLRDFEESSPYTLGIDPKALESIRTIRRGTPSSLESATLMNGLDLDSVGLVSISDFVAWIWISSPYAWNRSPFLRRTLFGFAAWIGSRLRMYACRTLWIPFVRNPFFHSCHAVACCLGISLRFALRLELSLESIGNRSVSPVV